MSSASHDNRYGINPRACTESGTQKNFEQIIKELNKLYDTPPGGGDGKVACSVDDVRDYFTNKADGWLPTHTFDETTDLRVSIAPTGTTEACTWEYFVDGYDVTIQVTDVQEGDLILIYNDNGDDPGDWEFKPFPDIPGSTTTIDIDIFDDQGDPDGDIPDSSTLRIQEGLCINIELIGGPPADTVEINHKTITPTTTGTGFITDLTFDSCGHVTDITKTAGTGFTVEEGADSYDIGLGGTLTLVETLPIKIEVDDGDEDVTFSFDHESIADFDKAKSQYLSHNGGNPSSLKWKRHIKAFFLGEAENDFNVGDPAFNVKIHNMWGHGDLPDGVNLGVTVVSVINPALPNRDPIFEGEAGATILGIYDQDGNKWVAYQVECEI